MSEQGEIKQNITEAEYAATSATGDATITITNYYYREEARVVTAESADAADENLPCPYRGLFHFGPDEAEYFFGREIFVEELFAATQNRNFIPVLGASGSGKSSVVLAGLVPKLQKEGHWQFTHFRPGRYPFFALAEALVPLYEPDKNTTEQIYQARQLAGYFVKGSVSLKDVLSKIERNYPNHRVLLIADQFEELYTLCDNQKIRRQFLDCLLASFQSSSDNTTVLAATMRADFLGNVLSYRPFADILQNTDIKLGPMNQEELLQVIVKPADKLGVTFEAGLVERILDDVEDQPGNLPLLEFALTELWNKRTGKQLTHKIYEEIGQVEGALARHADQKYGNLTDEEKDKVRRIFIQLVRPGEGAEDTRRIAMKAELGEQSWSLVKQLADARLVVTSRNATSQETVEVVHEALIQNWGELREWMNTDRVFRAWQERLRVLKREWEATNKDPGSLLRGAALVEAEENLNKRPEDLISEKEFIQQSIQERDRLEKEKEARRRRDIRTAWGIAGGSLLAVIISTGLWLRAEYQQKQAELNLADSLARSSLSQLTQGKDLDAFVEGIRAVKILQKYQETDPDVFIALQEAVYGVRERNRLQGHDEGVRSISFSPDGQTIATASDDKTIKLWNVETGEEIRTLLGHDEGVRSVSFSPDGQTIATASDDKTIKLWSQTGNLLKTITGYNRAVLSVNFSPDGQMLAATSEDGTIQFWNLNGISLAKLYEGNVVYQVKFSPDGNTVASVGGDTIVKLWNLDGTLLQMFKGHQDGVYDISFSPDAQVIASASGDGTIRVWQRNGISLQRFHDHRGDVYDAVFSSDGQLMASGGADNVVKLRQQDGKPLKTLEGHTDLIHGVAFSPDNQILASASWDGTVKLWTLDGTLINTLKGHTGRVYGVIFSPDGEMLVTSSGDGTIKMWDLDGNLMKTLRGHTDVIHDVSFSPDGEFMVSASHDKTVRLWSRDGRMIKILEEHTNWVHAVAFSPDGQMIASASHDRTVKLWNLDGTLRDTLIGHTDKVKGVTFSPDGQTVASSSEDRTVRLWRTDGTPIAILRGHGDTIHGINFSPDGNTLSSASVDNTVILWNLENLNDLEALLAKSCNWLRGYLQNNPNVSEEDRRLCDGIGTDN